VLLQGHHTNEVPTFALWRRCRVDISRAVNSGVLGTGTAAGKQRQKLRVVVCSGQAQASPSTKNQDMCKDVTSTLVLGCCTCTAARVGVEWTLPETPTGVAALPCIDWLGALVAHPRDFRGCFSRHYAPGVRTRLVHRVPVARARCDAVNLLERVHCLLRFASPLPRPRLPHSRRYLHCCRYRYVANPSPSPSDRSR
jgi:hypothetical protein